MIMLRMREIRKRISQRTTGSRRKARMAEIATGIRTGCKNEIAATTMLPTLKRMYPIT